VARKEAHERFVVLLRGVNVGGNHLLPMAELRATLVERLGCGDVQTYIQSGNAVCAATDLTAGRIAAALEARFGFSVPIVIRTAAQWQALVVANPLLAAGADPEFLHLVLLEAPLSEAALEMLESKRAGEELLVLHGRELYLWLPHGSGRSKLALAMASAKMPAAATMRNWRTVLQLQAML
jgi:uncharacterized protein (DUF1697 family)